jgi:hypothetical protein
MHVRSSATIALEGWPPPTIEIQALIAALEDCGHTGAGGSATAFQHLNEVDLTFGFEVGDGSRADSRAQQIVHTAMSRLYGGPIHVHVSIDGMAEGAEGAEGAEVAEAREVVEVGAVGETARPALVIDLTERVSSIEPVELTEPVELGLFCAATGCERAAAAYSVSVRPAQRTDANVEVVVHLCAGHADSLGEHARPTVRGRDRLGSR